MTNDRITWKEPRTDDGGECRWSVWDTECGRYRIQTDTASAKYTPMCLGVVVLTRTVSERSWNRIARPRDTLDAAMDAINDYHCVANNLVLVATTQGD